MKKILIQVQHLFKRRKSSILIFVSLVLIFSNAQIASSSNPNHAPFGPDKYTIRYTAPDAVLLSVDARKAIEQAVQAWAGDPPENNTFYLISVRKETSWGYATLTSANLESPLAPNEESHLTLSNMFGVLFVKTLDGWTASLESDIRVYDLLEEIPESELSKPAREALFPSSDGVRFDSRSVQQEYYGYKFPWYSGQPWKVNNDWHDEYTWGEIFPPEVSLDFISLYSLDILASAPGVVTKKCMDVNNVLLVVKTAGTQEVLGYLHFDPSTVTLKEGDLVNQGTQLGRLKEGAFNSAGCGFSTGAHLHFYFPTKPFTIETTTFTQDNVHWGEDLFSTQGGTVPPPNPRPAEDGATFISDITIPDGSVVSAGQNLHKTWRLQNSGRTTWGGGYQLAFVSGEQMGAPGAVNVPNTAPGGQADISVDLVAPAGGGAHRGYWQLRNAQGTYFGDRIWVDIVVPGDGSQPTPVPTPVRPPGGLPDIQLFCLNCPAMVAPGTSFQPIIRVNINNAAAQLLAGRGDMLRNSGGNLFDAWPHVAPTRDVYAGQSYDFIFYSDHPLRAPQAEGTYTSSWRIWRNGGWAGPELTIRFTVSKNATGSRPPNAPKLSGPGDWSVFEGPAGINLQAQADGDPDGDAISSYYFEIFESYNTPNSGWISASNWQPSGLGYWGYQWRVKVRDEHGVESGWSEVRHFTVKDPTPRVDSFYWKWSDPALNNGNPWVIEFCGVYNGDGIRITLYSYATQTWWTLTEGGGTTMDCHGDPSYWHHRWYQQGWPAGQYKARLYVRKGGGEWMADPSKDVDFTTPAEQPANAPELFFPAPVQDGKETYVNAQTVVFDWKDTQRTTGYRLEVASDANFTNLLINQLCSTSDYSATFGAEYETLYWRVTALGPYGNGWSDNRFHIDVTPPNSWFGGLPAVTRDTAFILNWGAGDARSGVRWYDVQVREDNRSGESTWVNWLVQTTKTSEIFIGRPGHSYYFRVRAMDVAGNWEDWPAGEGDAFTLLNPVVVNSDSWWNPSYAWKRKLVINNNDNQTLPAHYPVHLHFDPSTNPTAAEIYNASSAGGADLRIVYNEQSEVDRQLAHFSASQVDLWFPLQAAIGAGAGDTTSYHLYYGNSSPGNPPADINTIFVPVNDAATLGLWHFQEGSGGSVADTSGQGNSGSFINPAWSDGGMGFAGNLNGSNAGIEIGNRAIFNTTAPHTLEAWIYTRSFNNSPLIFYKGLGGGQQQYFLRLTSDGKIDWFMAYDGYGCESGLISSQAMQPNTWYHIAAVFDGARERWLYINGEEKGHDARQSQCSPRSQSSPLSFGYASVWPGANYDGLIQHVRISSTRRSDFAAGKIDTPPALAAGAQTAKPGNQVADLKITDLRVLPAPVRGVSVEVTVQNVGNGPTQNNYFTDIFLNQLPAGTGLAGSLRFWVNDSIAPGATVKLVTTLDSLPSGLSDVMASGGETSGQLYARADSSGVVYEKDKANNDWTTGATVCIAAADGYESDDLPVWLNRGQPMSRNFHQAGDLDRFKFTAIAGQTYRISTTNLGAAADTLVSLYDQDGVTLLAENDDSGRSLASSITWQAPASGTYYGKVRSWNPALHGCGTAYTLNVGVPGPPTKMYFPWVAKRAPGSLP
jgi:murein DD-endopeptidase MepM/ murein hydrolase activator NlpD